MDSIENHQKLLMEIYGDVNKQNGIDYIFGYLSRSISYLGKNIYSKRQTNTHFMRATSWTFAVANFFGINLQQSFFIKFPAVCSYCLESPCMCLMTGKKTASHTPAYKAREELNSKYSALSHSTKDWSLDAAAANILKIYPNNQVIWHYSGPLYLISKLHEETGEVHEAISKFLISSKPKEAIGEELADILAWLLSAWRILNPNESIDYALREYFSSGCPVCHGIPCKCQVRTERAAELVDGETLKTLKPSLDALLARHPERSGEINELFKSLDSTLKHQSETEARKLFQDITDLINKIKEANIIRLSANNSTGEPDTGLEEISMMLHSAPWYHQ